MLEYTKTILAKVSFDNSLFKKELQKSLRWLDNTEIEELKKWVFKAYGEKHEIAINEVFSQKLLSGIEIKSEN